MKYDKNKVSKKNHVTGASREKTCCTFVAHSAKPVRLQYALII